MDTSAVNLGSKRRRVEKKTTRRTTRTLSEQDGIYSAEKFSDSFCISHVVNLLIKGEYVVHVCDHMG